MTMSTIDLDVILDHAVSHVTSEMRNETDLAGQPAILHILRVADKFEDPEYKIVALLHESDAVHSKSAEKKLAWLPQNIRAAAIASGRDYRRQSNAGFAEQVRSNPIATAVVLAAIDDRINVVGPAMPSAYGRTYILGQQLVRDLIAA